MKKLAVLMATPLLLAALSAPAAAQFEVGAKLGYNAPIGDHGDDFDGAFKYAFYGQYNFSPSLAAQVLYGRVVNDWKGPTPPGVDVEKDTDVVNINALYYFMPGPVRPYVIGGLDIVFWEVKFADMDETDYGFNIGAGASYTLGGNFSLGAEAVYHYIFSETDDDEPGPDYNAQTIDVMATISYGF